jgi:hypothetical protein
MTNMSLLLLLSTANAADLQTTLILPSGHDVYEEQRVKVKVKNLGGGQAKNVEVLIDLPETNTSPGVYVMGELGYVDTKCTQVGTQLQCNLGRIKPGKTKTVQFDIALPQSSGSLDFFASADSSSNESNPANNDDWGSGSVNYFDVPVVSGIATNAHCTGQGLEAYYECTLFPSSITSHDATFNADGSISFAYPGYAGTWYQASDDQMWFEYTLNGDVVAEFNGDGVDSNCFEGLTTFPNSAYVAPYEVCF